MKTNNGCIRVLADPVLIQNCRENIESANHSFEMLSRALNLAGNEVRLKILYLIDREDELCVCDLSDILEMKIPAISQHLRKLKDGNIVSSNKIGQTIFYSLNKEYKKLLLSFFKMISNDTVIKELV